MPVKNHLDYWQSLEVLKFNPSELQEIYKQNRKFIFNNILNKFEKNRKNWLDEIDKELKK